VISLQTVLGAAFHSRRPHRLELQGFAHYLGVGEFREVHLYGNERPPAWVAKLHLETKFVFHNARRLFKDPPTGRVAPGVERGRSLARGLVRKRGGSGSGRS